MISCLECDRADDCSRSYHCWYSKQIEMKFLAHQISMYIHMITRVYERERGRVLNNAILCVSTVCIVYDLCNDIPLDCSTAMHT